MAIHPTTGMSNRSMNKKGMTKTFHGTDNYPLNMEFKDKPKKPMSPTFHGTDMNPLTKSFSKS